VATRDGLAPNRPELSETAEAFQPISSHLTRGNARHASISTSPQLIRVIDELRRPRTALLETVRTQ
jgi:hypothetical protein